MEELQSPDLAPSAIEVREVNKSFRSGELITHVLHDVSCAIPQGSFTVIVGPSGSGKTTLMNVMGGIEAADTGSVLLNGFDISRASDEELTKHRRRSIGFIFQLYNLIASLNAYDNVRVGTDIAEDPMDPAEALALVGMEHRLEHYPTQLSGGEQQRVAIARAIAKRPRILFCDEPTGALDTETGERIIELLKTINRQEGVSIAMVTHNPKFNNLGDQLISIDSGRVTSEQIRASTD